MTGRDLMGYGGRWPDFVWPNGARVAVSLVINFEEGAELQVGDGDPVSERIGEVVSVVEPGVRDIGQEQIFAYGMRAGLWRLLDGLDGAGLPATIFVCGRAAERSPALLAEIARRGHELAVHGWRWRPHADYPDAETERRDIARCVDAITAIGAPAPVGFFCRGSESVHTRRLLAEAGFLYTSNGFDDDVPYWDRSGVQPLLVVPYALDTNDMKFFHPNGFVRAREMVDYVEDALTTLLAEGDRGRPRLLNVGFHLRIAGRPARYPAFAGTLELIERFRDRIYVGTRADIARAFAAAVPPA